MKSLRKDRTPVTRRMRVYFAPVDRATGTPSIFDPAQPFDLDAPPAPWLDVGDIASFRRTSATRVQPVHTGSRGAASTQFRAGLEARVEFDLREWGKLQMALAAGCEHMNVLAEDEDASPRGSGGVAVPAVALGTGSTVTQLVFAEAPPFTESDILAVDLDYAGQTGYVGSGIAAAYVRDSAEVPDADYIRRVTFNVARVASVSGNTVQLAQALLGGVPPQAAKVQKVVAFVDREGGSFFQEWSALFVLPDEAAGRVCFYYPRLQAAAPGQESAIVIAGPLQAHALHAAFLALPVNDANDSQPVLCYRSYFPPRSAGLS